LADEIIPKEKIVPGEVGKNYAKAHRMFGVLLYYWCTNTDVRRSLGSIPFDKLVTFSSRLWNELESIFKREKKISPYFHVPHEEFPGKHGPGYGIIPVNTGKVKYIGELLYDQQGSGIQQDIVAIPHEDIVEHKKNIRHESTMFTTGLIHPIKVNIMEKAEIFNEVEYQTIEEIGNIIRHLTEEEMRVLGTHENTDQTVHAIIFELEHWEELIKKALNLIENETVKIDDSGKSAYWYAQEAVEYASEAVKKASLNMLAYKEGWDRFFRHLSMDSILKEAFIRKQKKAAEIWNELRIKKLIIDAEKALTLSNVIRAICLIRQNGNLRTEKSSQIKTGKECSFKLLQLIKNPFQPELFNGNNIKNIHIYLDQKMNFEGALKDLKLIRTILSESMEWKEISNQIKK